MDLTLFWDHYLQFYQIIVSIKKRGSFKKGIVLQLLFDLLRNSDFKYLPVCLLAKNECSKMDHILNIILGRSCYDPQKCQCASK